MDTYTTTADAKDLAKILPLPKKMMKKKFKVIAIPIEENRKVLSDMKKIFSEAKKYKIDKKIDVDKIADQLNDEVF